MCAAIIAAKNSASGPSFSGWVVTRLGVAAPGGRLVIVDDFDIGRSFGSPCEANAPLVVDARPENPGAHRTAAGARRQHHGGLVQRALAALAFLEIVRHQLVPPEQLVEVGAVALRQSRRLADVPPGDLQDLRQVAARELIPRLVEGREPAG